MASTLNISLPPSLKKWVDKQAIQQGYETADAFVLEIVRREKALAARERVDALLAEAMSTGAPTPVTKETWARIRTNGRGSSRRKPPRNRRPSISHEMHEK
jgi:hypothetical protein